MPNPLYEFLFPGSDYRFHWTMGMSDRMGLLHVLRQLHPDAALEIGTYKGGSLEVISRYSRKAYSIDINPGVAEALRPHFDNVELLTGDSSVLIGSTLKMMADRGEQLQFALIDGDHSEAGARRDIELVLQHRPSKPMCIVVHDSFNPTVRRGIVSADWASNPHVHLVEVDFTTGSGSWDYNDALASRLWGGLALAVLHPEVRSGELQIDQESQEYFEQTKKAFGE